MMAAERGVSNGPNGRALDESLAETGAGIPDEAVVDGQLGPGELDDGADAALEKLKRSGWVEVPDETADDSEAHPS